jgi:hypothetical protein
VADAASLCLRLVDRLGEEGPRLDSRR